MSDTPETNSAQPVYSTRDIGLASTLICHKFFMIGIDYQIEGQKNQPVGYFKFADSPNLRAACQKYLQGMLLVDPREFQRNLHTLKSEVFNMTSNPHSSI